MGRSLRAIALPLALTLILGGCAIEDRGSSNTDGLRFAAVEIPGVTTDHASTGGVSWVDYDGDGDLDIFVSNGYDVSAEAPVGQPNQLYRNDGGRIFAAITSGALVEGGSISSSSTWGDYDNDGDLDVFIANQQDQNNELFRNEGGGVFTAIVDVPQIKDGGHSYAAAWVDVDGDGWLDLFVANGGLSHAGVNGLYRGIGGGQFEKISDGAIVTDVAATCGIAWGDYDNDGDPDLFIANQGFAPPANHNALYRNEGGWEFTRMEETPATTDGLPSCAATWVDVDNDLDLDLHVANTYGLADALYLNDGGGELSPLDGSPITLDGGHSYCVNWEDYDSDGDMDAVVANWGAAAAVYLNDGSGQFERVRPGDLGGRIDYVGALASGDFDADGNMDVYVGNWPNDPGDGELNLLYWNSTVAGHWLRIRLVGSTSNRSGITARVIVTTEQGGETLTQMREITTQMGFRGQSDLSPHFGLGSADRVQLLEVRWPSGQVSTLREVDADQIVEVSEPEPASG